jgi:hypothetical protein
VLRSLGVDEGVTLRADVQVPHRVARWAELNRRMASPGLIERAKRLTPAALHPVARRVASGVFRRNRRRATRPSLPPALLARLRDEFGPEVERLSELTGRDLASIWWRGSATNQ